MLSFGGFVGTGNKLFAMPLKAFEFHSTDLNEEFHRRRGMPALLSEGTNGAGSVFNTFLKDGCKGGGRGAGVSTLARVSERVI